MKLSIVVASIAVLVACTLPMASAWCMTFWEKDMFEGPYRAFHSNVGENGCYNIPSDVADKVNSYIYDPVAGGCRYELFSRYNCKGKPISKGGGDLAPNVPPEPYVYHAQALRGAATDIRSFKIDGWNCHLMQPSEIIRHSCDETNPDKPIKIVG